MLLTLCLIGHVSVFDFGWVIFTIWSMYLCHYVSMSLCHYVSMVIFTLWSMYVRLSLYISQFCFGVGGQVVFTFLSIYSRLSSCFGSIFVWSSSFSLKVSNLV